ncbi:MAG: hypothetical protein QME66_05440 [Candidatus Eisenbacteria bacterium]|nr:hypothetical protein [Candidatus Eisenbacteria bacterium]
MPTENMANAPADVGAETDASLSESPTDEASQPAASVEAEEGKEAKDFHEHPRWKEVIAERNELREQLATVSEKLDAIVAAQAPVPEPASEDWQPKTWDDVMTKAEERVLARLTETQRQQSEQARTEDAELQKALAALPTGGADLDEQAFLTFMVDHELSNVEKAYALYQTIEGKQSAGRKPTAPVGSSKKGSDTVQTVPSGIEGAARRPSFDDAYEAAISGLHTS